MNNNEPPDDFNFPNDENPEDDEPEGDSNHDSGQGGDDGDSNVNDLPEDWHPDDIPTGSELNHAGSRRLGELRDQLNQTTDLSEIAPILEATLNTLRLTQWLPKLVPQVIETGLALRSPAQKIGRLDIWEDAIFLLFHTIHDQLKTIPERSEYYKRIFASLSDFKANSGAKFPTESVLRQLASEYGMDNSEDTGWLLPRAAFLNAVILDYPTKRAEQMADELIDLAHRSQEKMIEMRVLLSKARLYTRENDYRRVFANAQQALVIALHIDAKHFFSDILFMVIASMVQTQTRHVERLFEMWANLRPNLENNMYEKALFYSIRGKFYYDVKADYEQAANAFNEAYECEKIQQRPVYQASNLLGAGMAMTKLGQHDIAQDYYHLALNIHKQEGNGEMEIWIRHAIGWNAKESGQIDLGIYHLVNALERALDLPMTTELERICKAIKDDLDDYRSSLNGK